MTVDDRLRSDADAIWERLLEHPFVTELYRGELPRSKFDFYLLHDYHYLITAMKNFGILAARTPAVDDMRAVIEILHLEAKSEYEGYEAFLHRLGYSIEDAAAREPIPIAISYGSYLLATSALGSYAEAITAVLPCFWSYGEIADRHQDKLADNENELYTHWAAVYTTDPYRSLVDKIKGLVNRAAENCPYETLLRAFTTSSRYEYLFWDAVYTGEQWPI